MLLKKLSHFSMVISPYYLSLANTHNYENDRIFKQYFPRAQELNISPCDMPDPLHEELDSLNPCIPHHLHQCQYFGHKKLNNFMLQG